MSKRIMLPLEYNLLTCPCLSMCSTHYSPSNSLLCTSCIYDIVLTLTPGQMVTSQKPYQSVSNIGTHNRNTYNQPHLWLLQSQLSFVRFSIQRVHWPICDHSFPENQVILHHLSASPCHCLICLYFDVMNFVMVPPTYIKTWTLPLEFPPTRTFRVGWNTLREQTEPRTSGSLRLRRMLPSQSYTWICNRREVTLV